MFQVIVSEDGIVGANYEHSTAEGPPVVSILDHSIKLAYVKSINLLCTNLAVFSHF